MGLRAIQIHSIKARRLKLCMWPLQIMSRVMGYMMPASTASEAVTSHGLFGVSKNIEGSIFRGQDRTSKLFSDLDLGGPDDLRSDLRGHLRPQFKKSLLYYFDTP